MYEVFPLNIDPILGDSCLNYRSTHFQLSRLTITAHMKIVSRTIVNYGNRTQFIVRRDS